MISPPGFILGPTLSGLVAAAAAGDDASVRLLEFFAATICNPHTRRVYGRAVSDFLASRPAAGLQSIAVRPLHVAAWVKTQARVLFAPTVKQRLAAVRHLFDWLVTEQIAPVNTAALVRGPSHVVRRRKTPALDAAEACQVLDSIDTSTDGVLHPV